MKKWTDDFISRALDGLPKDKYRDRAKAELTDHLLELADELKSGGYSPEEAQARAVELMGEPNELSRQYLTSWKQHVCSSKYIFPILKENTIQFLACCVLCRILCPFIIRFIFDGLFDDDFFIYWMFYDFYWFVSDHVSFVYALFVFLPGLLYGMRKLTTSLVSHPHRNRLLGIGLLTGWALQCFPLFPLFVSIFFLHEPPWITLADTEVWFDCGYFYLHPEYIISSFVLTLLAWCHAATPPSRSAARGDQL